MFDPWVWSVVDGRLYIARASLLDAKREEVRRSTPALDFRWADHAAVRRAEHDLRVMKTVGEA